MIQTIKNSNDVTNIIEFLGLSKFLNEFIKDTIKEIYDTLKDKELIKKDIIDSDLNLKKKIQTYLYKYNCQLCGKYVEKDDDYEEVVYHKDINDYICGSCSKELSISCYNLIYKYNISSSILKDINFFIHEEKDYSREMVERKFYFIKSIEEKINMPLHEYPGFLKKTNLDILKKNRYYALKTIKKIVEEKKEYDFDFFMKYCISGFNEYDMKLFDLNNPIDNYITKQCIFLSDTIYEKIVNIKNHTKTKEYSFEFVLDTIHAKKIKILRTNIELIIIMIDEEYGKIINNLL